MQVIQRDAEGRGILKFGTEGVTSQDGSIAALLGASPGASTAVAIMFKLLATLSVNTRWRFELRRSSWRCAN